MIDNDLRGGKRTAMHTNKGVTVMVLVLAVVARRIVIAQNKQNLIFNRGASGAWVFLAVTLARGYFHWVHPAVNTLP